MDGYTHITFVFVTILQVYSFVQTLIFDLDFWLGSELYLVVNDLHFPECTVPDKPDKQVTNWPLYRCNVTFL